MKISVLKLPALFGVLYAAFTVIVLIAASIVAFTKEFSTVQVGTILMSWEPHWWYLSIVGGLLHVVSFWRAKTKRMQIANTVGLILFVGYALVPNYALVLVLVHAMVIHLMVSAKVKPIMTPEEA